jgi:hypothetical protein
VKACARTFTGIVDCAGPRGSTIEPSTSASSQGWGVRSVYWPGGRCTRKRPPASEWMTRPPGKPRRVTATDIDTPTSPQSGVPGSRGIHGAMASPTTPLSTEVRDIQVGSEALTVSSPTSTPDAICRTLRIPVRRKRLMIGSAYGQDLRAPRRQQHRRPAQHLTTDLPAASLTAPRWVGRRQRG